MKLWSVFVFLIAIVSCASAEEANPSALKPVEVRDIPTVGAIELRDRLNEFSNKIIRLRFNSRSTNRLKPEGERLVGSLSEYGAGKSGQQTAAGVDVDLPKEAAPWYEKISDMFEEKATKTVFARVIGHMPGASGGTMIRVSALGTELRSGAKGPEFIWTHVTGSGLDAKLKAELAKEIPTFSAVLIKSKGKEFEGRVVRMQFSFRGNDLKDSIGELYDLIPKAGYNDSEFVSAIVPPEGAAWYKRISEGSDRARRQVAYVLVLGEPEPDKLLPVEKAVNYGVRVKVLGREMRQGFKGPEYIW